MSLDAEEPQAPQAADTPENTPDNTPEAGTGGPPESNWEDRYKEAQQWGTRNAQRVAELERYEQVVTGLNSDDPEQRRWAAEALGLQLEEEEPAEDTDTGYAPIDPHIEQRLSQFEQQQQAQAEQAQFDAVRKLVAPELKELGLTGEFADYVYGIAYDDPIETPQGVRPNIQGALQQLEQLIELGLDVPAIQGKAFKKLQASKRAPSISSSGIAGTQVPDLDKRSDRQAYLEQRMQDG